MKKNKYNNKKTVRIVNGEPIILDSLAEARHYDKLIILAKAQKITELKLQPKFLLVDTLRVEGHKTMPKRYYITDFSYIQDERKVVVDVKGFKTPMYNLKKHLFLAKYGNELMFKEVK